MPEGSKSKVLVLDDSDVVLRRTKDLLESAGYAAVTLTSPFLLLKVMERERPDVVLLDVKMPALDGCKLLDISRNFDLFRLTPVVLFSDLPVAELERLMAHHGADGFIQKSWSREQILEAVARWARAASERHGDAPRPEEPAPEADGVAVQAANDLEPKLRTTILFRPGVERFPVGDDPAATVELIHERRPRLLILDGRSPQALELIRHVRADRQARHISIAVLLDQPSSEQERQFRQAGANAILSEWQSPPVWDDAFQDLLRVPPRRWVTRPVLLTTGTPPEPTAVTLRNISVRGFLVETAHPVRTGTMVTLSFHLGEPPDLLVEGRIVWERTMEGGLTRQGILLVQPHGDALARIAAFVFHTVATEDGSLLSS